MIIMDQGSAFMFCCAYNSLTLSEKCLIKLAVNGLVYCQRIRMVR